MSFVRNSNIGSTQKQHLMQDSASQRQAFKDITNVILDSRPRSTDTSKNKPSSQAGLVSEKKEMTLKSPCLDTTNEKVKVGSGSAFHKWTPGFLPPARPMQRIYKGIVAFDYDQTIVDAENSNDGDNMILHNDRLSAAIKRASDLDLLVIVVTARSKKGEAKNPSWFRVATVMEQLEDLNNFKIDGIYYTVDKDKLLEALREQYKLNKSDVCIMDDRQGYLMPCEKLGFHTIISLLDSEESYDKLDKFLDRFEQKLGSNKENNAVAWRRASV